MSSKKVLIVLYLLIFSICAAGCSYDASLSTVDSLFSLPVVPEVFQELSEEIDNMCANGFEYVAPTSGANIQNIQMRDLNTDGELEAIVFLRKEGTNLIQIRVYQKRGMTYEQLCTIEKEVASIDTIYYEDFTGDGRSELIVGWKMINGQQRVTMYSIGREAIELMSSNYRICELQKIDGIDEPILMILKSDGGVSVAEFYRWQTDLMAVSDRCELSSQMSELANGSIVNGTLSTEEPALFVTGVSDINIARTDVLAVRNNHIINIEDTNENALKFVYEYRQLTPQDINGDGITEIPYAQKVIGIDGMVVASIDTLVSWVQYDHGCEGQAVEQTFHCQSGGWYYTIPESWWESVSVTTVETGSGESQNVFSIDQNKIMSIYSITGDNRENRGLMGNRFIMKRQNSAVFAAELYEGAQDYSVTEEQLRKNFNLIGTSWTSNS